MNALPCLIFAAVLTVTRFIVARSCLPEIWPTPGTALFSTHGEAAPDPYIEHFSDYSSLFLVYSALHKLPLMEASWLLVLFMPWALASAKHFLSNSSMISSSSTSAARDWDTTLCVFAGDQLDHFTLDTCLRLDTLGGKQSSTYKIVPYPLTQLPDFTSMSSLPLPALF